MKIADCARPSVTVPLEAPLRHANGCHWGRFVRTIVELETDTGSSGSARWAAAGRARTPRSALKRYLVGRDPARLEEMRFLLANPTASLYNNRTQLVAALEFACLDILGQTWGVPVSDILGGRVPRSRDVRVVPVLPVRAANGKGTVRPADQLVRACASVKAKYGFTTTS
jgi:glucarate dehydratase